jgi:hypothetical protein
MKRKQRMDSLLLYKNFRWGREEVGGLGDLRKGRERKKKKGKIGWWAERQFGRLGLRTRFR